MQPWQTRRRSKTLDSVSPGLHNPVSQVKPEFALRTQTILTIEMGRVRMGYGSNQDLLQCDEVDVPHISYKRKLQMDQKQGCYS